MAKARIGTVLAAAILAACAKADSDPPAAGDAGADGAACTDGACDYEGVCELPTQCHPLFPGLVCAAGTWLETCGNGICDCGERPDACSRDCACEGLTCADEVACVAPGTCRADGTPSVCTAGAFAASCGDGTCNCGETLETCARDCPPEGPYWTGCLARTGQWESCSEHCSTLELRCADSCTTTRGRQNWGAESWPEGENCAGDGNAEALCDDPWGDGVGAEPHWRCCCAP